MEQQINIDEKDHAAEILKKLNRMRENKEHCDFTVKVGSVEMPVHKNVLSAGSDYFQAMLSHDNVETRSGLVEIKESDLTCVKKCIDFIYTGEVFVSEENCEQLMYVAQIMQLRKMCDGIAIYLEDELSPRSFFTTKLIANTFNCPRLAKRCNKFALENFRSLVNQDGFQHLEEDYISYLSKEAKVSEAVKCKALIIWTRFDTKNRTSTFEEIFGNLNLAKISMKYIMYMTEREALVFNSVQCMRELMRTCMFGQTKVKPEDVDVESDTESNNVIAMFDITSKSIQAFDPEKKTWTRMQDISNEFIGKEFTAALLDDVIYVLVTGGTNYQLNYTNADATWVRLPDRSLAKNRGIAVELQGSIYAFDDYATNAAVEKFDPSAGTWSHVTNKPMPASYKSIIAAGGSIYCIGGYNYMIGYLSNIVKFDPSESTWTTLPAMPTARSVAAAVELDGKIYVMGGYTSCNSDVVECFDRVTETWTTVASLNNARRYFTGCTIGGKIFVVGGSNSNDTIEEFNPTENTWKVVETMTGKTIMSIATITLNVSAGRQNDIDS